MKRALVWIITLMLLISPVLAAPAENSDTMQLTADFMEQRSGEILYEKNAHAHLSPASVTKVMTILLIAEQIDSGAIRRSDTVTASGTAAAMGGSQVYLEAGETMTVDEMLKCIVIASANDCAVAMAEHIAGTESAFVERMNARAAELGLQDTHFVNCTGLTDDDAHYTSAYDIAMMSREVLRHDWLTEYTTIWTDNIRGGEFGLTNTNKLVRIYQGATGLKTGFTNKAMYCLSATAKRDNDAFIAVVLHAPSSAERFEDAQALLNYAFANYTVYAPAANTVIPPVRIELGTCDSIQPVLPDGSDIITSKGSELQCRCEIPESIPAPVKAGDEIGKVQILNGEEVVQQISVTAPEDVARISLRAVENHARRAVMTKIKCPFAKYGCENPGLMYTGIQTEWMISIMDFTQKRGKNNAEG